MTPVCVIAPSSLRYTPYLRYYRSLLEKSGIPHDVYLWDRYGTGETLPGARVYAMPGTARGAALLPAYAGYRRFLLRELKAKRYDTFVILSTQVAVLLADFLSRRRFILDIRDFSHEEMWLYRWVARSLVRRAVLVCISSRGFLEWLPAEKCYTISHNVAREDLVKTVRPFDTTRRVIASIGATSYARVHRNFIEGLGRCGGLDLRYYGDGPGTAELREYCGQRALEWIQVAGAFRPVEKPALYEASNFVLGLYDPLTAVGRTLTPNRLYESCVFRRPMLVNDGTHVATIVASRRLGIVCNLNNMTTLGKEMDQYYRAERYQEYEWACEQFLADVLVETRTFEERVLTALRGT